MDKVLALDFLVVLDILVVQVRRDFLVVLDLQVVLVPLQDLQVAKDQMVMMVPVLQLLAVLVLQQHWHLAHLILRQ